MADNNSGVQARKWRRSLAAAATRVEPTTRTLKFKLNLGDHKPFTFDQACRLYNVTEGTGKGSLTGLLFAVHLSGFRVFMKAADTDIFRSAACFQDDEFVEAFTGSSGLDLPDFRPSLISKRLQTEVRARGGKDNRFVPEVIAREYCRTFTGKLPTEQTPPEIVGLFDGLGHALASEFSSWSDLQSQTTEACACIDRFLSSRGWKLPAIESMAKAAKPSGPPNATIAFDPLALTPEGDISGIEPHLVVAMRLRDSRSEGVSDGKKLRAAVQQKITTDNNAGMSWLFGVGLKYLQETALTALASDFAVPPKRLAQLQSVADHAKAIPPNDLFEGASYAQFRMTTGGRLDSWVGNYLNRLFQLEALISVTADPFSLPSIFFEAEGADFLSGTGLNAQELQGLIATAEVQRGHALAALTPLLGKSANLPTKEDIATIEGYARLVDSLAGVFAMIRAKVDRHLEDASTSERRADIERFVIKEPDWLAPLPAINKLRGGVPDFRAEVETAIADFFQVQSAMDCHLKEIEQHCVQAGCPLDPIAALADQERLYLGKFKASDGRTELDPRRRALQIVLDRFGRAARRCSERAMLKVKGLYEELGVFADPKDASRYFHNKLGSLFRPVFSKSRHQPYAVNFARLQSDHVLSEMGKLITGFAGNADGGSMAGASDRLTMLRAWNGVQLSGVTITVPSALARPRIDDGLYEMPAILDARLKDQVVSAEVLQRVFNLYQSVLSGLNVIANRQKFFVRVRFQRVGDAHVLYSPKPGKWKAPERLWQTSRPIRAILDDDLMVFDEAAGKPVIDTEATVRNLISRSPVLTDASAQYLVQSPHSWAYCLEAGSALQSLSGITVGKGETSRKVQSRPGAYTLVGPSSAKGQLDRFLTEPRAVSAGDFTLIIDNAFRQRVTKKPDGTYGVEIDDLGYTASIAVPINEAAPVRIEGLPIADRYVAIDQGERGLAYAVFDSKSHDLLASGVRRIPSIYNLIKAANSYRKHKQPTQKFQQRFDSTMFVMRENVVGDVCHEICGLMRKYKAFPVLESTVRNLEGGSKQLELVYKAVSARFLFSDTEAHKTARKAYWLGADRWEHPHFKGRELDKLGKPTGKVKTLSLFPGAGVAPKGTSQVCSVCGRNPYTEIEALAVAGKRKVSVRVGGEVELPGGTIRLFAAPDEKTPEGQRELKSARRRNERSLLSRPIRAGDVDLAALKAIVRRNLRRPHPSKQSKDTTQSQYHCVYLGGACEGKSMHADENAAINIGRKFRAEKLWSE